LPPADDINAIERGLRRALRLFHRLGAELRGIENSDSEHGSGRRVRVDGD
jgi:hypothetical protein